MSTGIAAVLAIGIGILGHELLHGRPVISAALPPALLFGVLRFPWKFDGSRTAPSLFEAADIAALVVAFLGLAWMHARRRRRAAADVDGE